jgi:hypothetical protein
MNIALVSNHKGRIAENRHGLIKPAERLAAQAAVKLWIARFSSYLQSE